MRRCYHFGENKAVVFPSYKKTVASRAGRLCVAHRALD